MLQYHMSIQTFMTFLFLWKIKRRYFKEL